MYWVKKIHSIDLLLFPPLGVYILIAVGAVMMFVGFLGCYGAIQESQCLLGTVSHTLSSQFICHIPQSSHSERPECFPILVLSFLTFLYAVLTTNLAVNLSIYSSSLTIVL